ncbi:ATP synthase subunit I [uncultured Pseudodesulfovibrio sp.]|uniref:ATP synthase subunit I n=1 Tax=uncultured Pseudodesulfovibrio sp. TaxID=2035858 RepID=UPI0029C7D42E|nr:ATP synthase subunit I [uncultured Pseudodesulfovibrio sp.]
MLNRINQTVERMLVKSGFALTDVRVLVRNQIYVSLGTSLVIGLVTLFSRWSLAYAAGAVIALANFWTLARIVQHLAHKPGGGPFVLFVIFMVKMTLSGLAFYWLIGVERVPHWGLISGLGTVVVNVTVTGLIQMGNKRPS